MKTSRSIDEAQTSFHPIDDGEIFDFLLRRASNWISFRAKVALKVSIQRVSCFHVASMGLKLCVAILHEKFMRRNFQHGKSSSFDFMFAFDNHLRPLAGVEGKRLAQVDKDEVYFSVPPTCLNLISSWTFLPRLLAKLAPSVVITFVAGAFYSPLMGARHGKAISIPQSFNIYRALKIPFASSIKSRLRLLEAQSSRAQLNRLRLESPEMKIGFWLKMFSSSKQFRGVGKAHPRLLFTLLLKSRRVERVAKKLFIYLNHEKVERNPTWC